MENSLEPLYGAGGETSGVFPSYDAMFSGVSLQSVLTMNPPVFSDFASALPPSGSLMFQNDELPYLLYQRESDRLLDNQLMDYDRSSLNHDLFTVPKLEPLYFLSEGAASTELPTEQGYDFLPVKSEPGNYNDSFHRLPDLSSLEPAVPGSLNKRLGSGGAGVYDTQTQMVDYSMLVQQNFQYPMLNHRKSSSGSGGDLFNQARPYGNKRRFSSSPLQKVASPAKKNRPAVALVMPQSSLARQRRQKLSDKTRCLQKLLPWDKKMDMATMLEETYKYVKFLQAQLCALKSMPTDLVSAIADRDCNGNGGRFIGLEKLNRNQVLQVLVNSPVAQTLLYSQKCCVFSVEQIALVRNVPEKRYLHHMVMFDTSSTHASSKTLFN